MDFNGDHMVTADERDKVVDMLHSSHAIAKENNCDVDPDYITPCDVCQAVADSVNEENVDSCDTECSNPELRQPGSPCAHI